MSQLELAVDALRRGRFRDALAALDFRQVSGDPVASLVLSEALLYSGDLFEARRLAELRNAGRSVNPTIRAQSLLLLGLVECELSAAEGVDKLRQAALEARQSGQWMIASRALLNVLERTCDSSEYRSSLPLCSETIDAVRRSGDRE